MLYRVMLALAFVMVLTAQSCATYGDDAGEKTEESKSEREY
jgi:hypothetical protein